MFHQQFMFPNSFFLGVSLGKFGGPSSQGMWAKSLKTRFTTLHGRYRAVDVENISLFRWFHVTHPQKLVGWAFFWDEIQPSYIEMIIHHYLKVKIDGTDTKR